MLPLFARYGASGASAGAKAFEDSIHNVWLTRSFQANTTRTDVFFAHKAAVQQLTAFEDYIWNKRCQVLNPKP